MPTSLTIKMKVLSPIGRVPLIKAIAPQFPLSNKFINLFGTLVSVAIQQAVSAHNATRDAMELLPVKSLRDYRSDKVTGKGPRMN